MPDNIKCVYCDYCGDCVVCDPEHYCFCGSRRCAWECTAHTDKEKETHDNEYYNRGDK